MFRIFVFVLPICVAVLCGCQKDRPSGSAPSATTPPDASPATALSSKVVDAADAKKPVAIEQTPCEPMGVPPELRGKGAIVGCLHFRDRRGENWAVFSELRVQTTTDGETTSESIYLYANHFRDGALVRSVKDKYEGCTDDLVVGFVRSSFGVTDVDSNGIGEVTFAYDSDRCVTDMGNFTMKLLTLEDGAKYIVRGMTLLREEDDPTAGSAEIARALAAWPDRFRDHGRARWRKLRWFPRNEPPKGGHWRSGRSHGR